MENKIYDTIVIGNGPAGISCAIYLKRFNREVLVIGKDAGALEVDSYIDNYYGIPHIKGKDLISAGINQAKDLGIEVIKDEVLEVHLGEPFKVECKENIYISKTIFLATGKSRTKLNIKNIKEFDGKGISYCAICDGFIYRGKRLGIIGAGDYMKKELETLKRFTQDITVFTNGIDISIEGFNVVTEKIDGFYGDKKLKGIKTVNKEYNLDGVFIAIGSANTLSFAKHIGIVTDDNGNILVENYKTNIDGIYSGGDAIGGLLQVVKSASDGAEAALEINKFLKKNI